MVVENMTVLEIVGGILLIVSGLILIVAILLQTNDTEGFDVISGGSFGASRGGQSRQQTLAKITKYVGIGFFALSFIVWLLGVLF